nr:hypothetical protein [Candidatus Sigynarchaeota archaeon]
MDRNVQQILDDHEVFIKTCLRLLPSENILSVRAKNALISDVSGRYHVDFYGGKKFITELVDHVAGLARKVFRAKHAFVTPLSGTFCVLSTLLAFTKPGEKVGIVSSSGGFPFNIEYFGRKRVLLPMDNKKFNLNLQMALDVIEKEQPRLVFLGTSFMLHPIPELGKIVAATHEHGGVIAYDGSHPLGLITGGQFQDPLRDDVDLLIGSTHKSFFGPQGGIIVTNSDLVKDKLTISIGADPGLGVVLVDNPNPGRIAALGIALEEMIDHGAKYANQVIKNASALQSALLATSLKEKIAGMAQGPTDSHQVYVHVRNNDECLNIMRKLEACGLLCDAGVRLGTAEATRLGYIESDMVKVGEWIGTILDPGTQKSAITIIKRDIGNLIKKHQEIVL